MGQALLCMPERRRYENATSRAVPVAASEGRLGSTHPPGADRCRRRRVVVAGAASSGTPRLVVDRTEIDLGDLPFDQRATAVFTLTNAGNGVLNIIEEPPVEVVKGC
jgi:hypothetical protein